MDILKALYREIVCELAFGNLMKSKTHATHADDVADVHDKYEPRLKNALNKWLLSTNKRLNAKSFAFLIKHFDELNKSDDKTDVKETLRQIIEASFAGSLSDDLLDEIGPMIDDLSKLFSSSYEVKLNYKLVNTKATEFLRTRLDSSFSTLSKEASSGIYSAIADAMASDKGYSAASIVDKILSSAFNPSEDGKMYFEDKALDASQWANMVAVTETATAASASTKQIADSIDLQTWAWAANNGACDLCEPNDGEIVAIGDSFPSGDTEAPVHPLCRCVMILVQDEIQALGNDDSSDSDSE